MEIWPISRRPSLLRARPSFRDLRPLLKLGGWMTISNIVYPALVYGDRFVIASVLSAAEELRMMAAE